MERKPSQYNDAALLMKDCIMSPGEQTNYNHCGSHFKQKVQAFLMIGLHEEKSRLGGLMGTKC
jgi:hypothetical protein